MFPIETSTVTHDNNEVLTVKLRHETCLVAYSTDKHSMLSGLQNVEILKFADKVMSNLKCP